MDKLQPSEFIRILIGLSVSVPMMNDYSVRLRTHTLHFFDFELSHHETYESEAFSLSYPNIFFIKEVLAQTGLQKIYICADSTDNDKTTILWESPGTFPSDLRDFVTIFTS